MKANSGSSQSRVSVEMNSIRRGQAACKRHVHKYATRNKKQTPERLRVRAFFGNTLSDARAET